MHNITEYRKRHIIGQGKRVYYFIHNELTAEELQTVKVKRGRYNSGTYLNDELFERFKKWLFQDNRFRK